MNAITSIATLCDLEGGSGELDVHQTFNGAKLTWQYVFSNCLYVMAYAAKYGPMTPCVGVMVGGAFTMTSELDDIGKSMLGYRHLFKAMRFIANTTVQTNSFEEMDVELWKIGVKIASGRLKAGGKAAAIRTDVNSTVADLAVS